MAKFCENCGNPIDEGAAFCDSCGARLGGGPAVEQQAPQSAQYPQQSAQYPQQPVMQYPQQPAGNYPSPNAYPYPQQPKKKKGGLIALIAGVCAVALAAVVVLVVVPKLKAKPAKKDPGESVWEPAESTPSTAQKPAENPAAVPDFEKYGIAADLHRPGESFDVITQLQDSGETIIGTGKLDTFTREPISQETVALMEESGEDVRGYEVLRVKFVSEFPRSSYDGENQKFKGDLALTITDYNNIDQFENSREKRTDVEGKDYYRCTVTVGGETKQVYYRMSQSAKLQDQTVSYRDYRTFMVPAGYDGIVCGYRDVRLADENPIYRDYSAWQHQLVRLIGGDAPAPVETSAPAETSAPTEPPTTEPTPPKAEDPLPYSSLGVPQDTDFAWIADARSGSLTGNLLGKADFVGKWKAEILFDGIFELLTVTIARDGTVTLAPYMINYGDGWMDESGEGPYPMNGAFDYGGAGNIYATGIYGNLELYQFLESDGTQYGLGKLTLPSGEVANVYMVRP